MLRRNANPNKRRPRPDEEMDLMEHLDELRGRLFRCILYVFFGGIIAWFWLYTPILDSVTSMLNSAMRKNEIPGHPMLIGITQPFFLRLKVTALLALGVASPFLLAELWGFISPGLLPHERRPFKFVFPFAVLLFISGAGLSYAILPKALDWFVSYQPKGVALNPDLAEYLMFVVKMCGAFGVGFELPVVMMFLGKLGVVNSKIMRKFWRQAVVLIMLAAAILTPSNDPFSMLMMAVPMALLYLGSIALVKWVEPKNLIYSYGDEDEAEEAEEAAPALHPVPISVDEED